MKTRSLWCDHGIKKVSNGKTRNGKVQVSTGAHVLAVLLLFCDISGQLDGESP